MKKGLLDNVNITIINNGESDYSFVDDENNNNNNNNENIADKSGKYEKFTGTINWKGIKAKVRNATFELNADELKPIVWKSGIWENGTWNGGIWENGTWEDGRWWNGTWENGIWKSGIWENGIWNGGRWWDGIWWKGYDKNKNIHVKNSPDKW